MFTIQFQDEAGNPQDLNSTISLDILSLNDTVPPLSVDLYDAMDLSTGMIYHEIDVETPNMSIVMELVPPNTEFEVCCDSNGVSIQIQWFLLRFIYFK